MLNRLKREKVKALFCFILQFKKSSAFWTFPVFACVFFW